MSAAQAAQAAQTVEFGQASGGPAALKVTQLRVIGSEWTKLVSLRSTLWTLLVAVVSTVALGGLIATAAVTSWDQFEPAARAAFDPTETALAGTDLAQIAIGVLGVLMMTGEYSTGMIRATFSAVPTRLPVLWAKTIVFSGVSFVLMLVSCLAAFLLGQAVLASEGIGTSLGEPGVLAAVVGTAFYLTSIGVLGVALGALVRNTAGAIAALFGILLGLVPLVGLLPSELEWIGDYLPLVVGATLKSVVSDDGLPTAGGVAVLCAYMAVALAAAAVLLKRRDV
mgnify:CR=1 FL=1